MKKYILISLLILGMFFIVNIISYAHWIKYRIIVTVRGRTIYTDTINESEYKHKWKYIVPYSFREDIEKEICRIPAIVEIKRIIW